MKGERRNQMLITIDSVRWDVFNKTPNLWLKQFVYSKAYTHGTFTLPAHTSFFIGKLPCTFKGEFDTCARPGRTMRGQNSWRLDCPECMCPATFNLPKAKNIVDGFNQIGYKTYGTGAVNWFNTDFPSHVQAVDDFQKFVWFGDGFMYYHGEKQINFMAECAKEGPFFAFINFGETHAPYEWKSGMGGRNWKRNFKSLFKAQSVCLTKVDEYIKQLLTSPCMKNTDVIVCADHGDCMGEDGLFGHSFFHEKVIEVPIIKVST